MSRTLRTIQWSVLVADPDTWTPAHRDAANASSDGGGYDDWVTDQLTEVMHAAGQRWIAEHPDLIVGDLT